MYIPKSSKYFHFAAKKHKNSANGCPFTPFLRAMEGVNPGSSPTRGAKHSCAVSRRNLSVARIGTDKWDWMVSCLGARSQAKTYYSFGVPRKCHFLGRAEAGVARLFNGVV